MRGKSTGHEAFCLYSHKAGYTMTLLAKRMYTTKLPAMARDLGADVVHFAYPVPFVRKSTLSGLW